jgi:zinc protease
MSGLRKFCELGRPMQRLAAPALAFCLILFGSFAEARAMNIQKLVSPKGIEVWLVEDHTLPMLAMQFGFEGGSAQDPVGKEGLAYFVSGTLDEGAGDIESQDFKDLLEGLAIDLSFDANRDVMTGGIKTLTKNKDEAFRLLRLSLTEPRMDEEAVERVREQIFSIIKVDQESPENVASESWFAQVFPGHPYSSPTKGTLDSIRRITREDLKGFVKRNFARDKLHIAVVGDITPEELTRRVDEIFGSLPAKAELRTVPEASWKPGISQEIIPMATPQSVVNFGQPGPKRKDEDFMPAYVLNYILGGGGFASRLMTEVREKRGLAYSVYTYLQPYDRAGIWLGGVATENKSVGESIRIIKSVLSEMAERGPTPEELADAKRYLTGSYALRFSSSSQIAGILLWLQIEDLGIDYIDKRNALVEAVTIEDIKRVAKTLQPDKLIITIVGQPEGLSPGEEAGKTAPARAQAPRG